MISCSSMGVLFWVPLLLKAMLAGDFGGHVGPAHGAPPPAPAHPHGPDREQVLLGRTVSALFVLG